MSTSLGKHPSEAASAGVAAPTRLDSRFTSLMPHDRVEIREGYAKVGDQSLHYVEAGDGPLIVLLHGFPEFWFGWRLQIAPLAAAGFRVVAPDTRGYNLSSKPEGFEDYAVDLLAADIRGLIGELGAESALLVGHDWGGSIAWTTAMNHPEVVDRLVILNAAHPRKLSEGLKHPSQLRKSWYFFFFATPGLPEEVVHARDWHFFRHFLEDASPPYTPQEIERYVESWSQPGAPAGMINYYRASVRQSQKEATAKLRPISAPTLVIWGSATPTSAPSSPSPTGRMCPISPASSAWPTRRTGSITTSLNASTNCSSTSSPERGFPRGARRLRRRAPPIASLLDGLLDAGRPQDRTFASPVSASVTVEAPKRRAPRSFGLRRVAAVPSPRGLFVAWMNTRRRGGVTATPEVSKC